MLIGALLASDEKVSLSAPTEVFDQYGGGLKWEDEKARLDNFAIQLQQHEEYVGYILVFDAIGGCPGEAQTRAIRAKRYVVEHRVSRGTAWSGDGRAIEPM